MRKEKEIFYYVCENCGKKQKPQEVRGNFEIYDTKCIYCGGSVTLKFNEDK